MGSEIGMLLGSIVLFAVAFGLAHAIWPIPKKQVLPQAAGGDATPPPQSRLILGLEIPIFMRVLLSCVLVAASLAILVGGDGFSDAARSFATGTTGTIVGYWFPK